MRGKLQSGCPDLPYTCDVCGRARSLKVHTRCSKIRQERHAQLLRDEAFDNALMDDVASRRSDLAHQEWTERTMYGKRK